MWMVKAERNKGHKYGYSEVRWYFTNKRFAQKQVRKAWDSEDVYGAFMYRSVKLVRLENGTKETLR